MSESSYGITSTRCCWVLGTFFCVMGWIVAFGTFIKASYAASIMRTIYEEKMKHCAVVSGGQKQLICFECYYSNGFNLLTKPDYQFEESCLDDPINSRKCSEGEYCSTMFQLSQDNTAILIKRFCHTDTSGKSKDEKYSCQKSAKGGIDETNCNCFSNKCLPLVVFNYTSYIAGSTGTKNFDFYTVLCVLSFGLIFTSLDKQIQMS